ncbi:hypothetical protein [Treponema sp.]|uniref:hypothetical protein n=1 Tax=Treponema sp. TaxID=166 RepID=UPI003F0CF5AD
MKRFLCVAALSISAAFNAIAFEQTYFNGYTGFLAGVQNEYDSDDFDPCTTGETFLAGQIDFGGRLFLRGEFYTRANDIFDCDALNEDQPNSNFRVEEVSATYKINSTHASHYVSLYYGNFEPIGSDLFLQRQFGIKPIRSSFTDSFHGLAGARLYPLYAQGIGYTFHPEGDFAAGVNLYKNKAAKEDGQDDILNFDIRMASLIGNSAIDFTAGLALPSESNEGDDDALIYIKEIQLHGGLNFLVGNRNTTSVLFQVGVNKFITRKDTSDSENDRIDLKDVWAFVEPRANGKYMSIDTAGFLFPAEAAQDMIFLRNVVRRYPGTENVFGANINIHTDKLYAGATRISLGAHTTLAFSRVDPDGDDKIETSLCISPYAGIDILGGSLSASVSVNTLDLADDPEKSYSATIGFKTQF